MAMIGIYETLLEFLEYAKKLKHPFVEKTLWRQQNRFSGVPTATIRQVVSRWQ